MSVTASIRHIQPKYGFYTNMEQAITRDIGIFARASWNDGQTDHVTENLAEEALKSIGSVVI
jgi:hypothetical protein